VIKAEATSSEPLSKEHPILEYETLKVIRNWTFGCFKCEPNAEYEHTLVFLYRLEGDESSYNNSWLTMDLPDQVTITANPPQTNALHSREKN
jgi:hypothetical protein